MIVSPNRTWPLRIVVLTYPCDRVLHVLDSLDRSDLFVEAVLLQRRFLLGRAARLTRQLGIRATAMIAIRRLKKELFADSTRSPHRMGAYRTGGREVVTVRDLNCDDALAALQRLAPDVGVVGCAGILRPAVLNAFRYGVLNIHPGITPRYRGRSPMEWAILEGAQPGVTLHFIDAGVDTGPVVRSCDVPVCRGDDFGSLYERAYAIGFELLVDSLEALQRSGSLPSVAQNWKHTRLRHSMDRGLRRVARCRLRERAMFAPG